MIWRFFDNRDATDKNAIEFEGMNVVATKQDHIAIGMIKKTLGGSF